MQIICKEKPLDVYKKAAEIAYSAVAHTLGPGGTNTAIVNKRNAHDIINDGYTILSKLTDLDAATSEALETIKLAAFETNKKAGDGTTSTTILVYELLSGAINYLENNNITKVKLRNTILEYRDNYIDTLHQALSKEIKDSEYEAIAKVSLGSSKYSSIISDAYRFLPKGLRPSVIRADIGDVVSEKKDGIVLDKAECILSQDDFDKGARELNDVDVYCIYDKLDRWQQIQPIIEQIIRTKRTVILFYNELSMDILQNIQLQVVKGYADIVPIRLGSMGVQTRNTMNQVSMYTNSTLVDGVEVKLPRALKDINIGHLDYALLSQDTVVINNKDFEDISSITLPTRSVIIRVGGTNVSEVEENFRRIEDAVNSLGNAIESGISIGAGLTYQHLAESSDEDTPKFITDALESIYKRIIYNITGDSNISSDYDGLIPNEYGSYCVADELQVFDATKVIEQVILNSFTLVSQLITTELIIMESVR